MAELRDVAALGEVQAERVTVEAGRGPVPGVAAVPEIRMEAARAVMELEVELQAAVRGEVRFDSGGRALYATDASNYRQVPLGVVLPLDKDDLIRTVEVCHSHGAPITMRGCGTSLAGQTCNNTVVIDASKYVHGILEINPDEKYARVEPGVILDSLRDAAEEYNLTYGPDPATHTHCTLGGMIGNNSCGVHSVYAGKTVDNIEALEILTYDGERMWVGPTSEEELERIIAEGRRRGRIYAGLKAIRDKYADLIREKYPHIPRRVSGYNLDQLLPENGFNVARALVGTESTCVVILEAKTRLVHSPPARSLLVLGYPDVYHAGDHIPEILESSPLALEGLDNLLVRDMKTKNLHPRNLKLLPDGGGWLLVEFGGKDKAESDSHAHELMDRLKDKLDAPNMKLFDDPKQEQMVWKIRESGLGATANIPGRPLTWPGWEDSAVPPDKVGAYLRDLRALLDKYGYLCDLYGHFGQGCIHTRIDFDLFTKEGIEKYRQFMGEATDLILKYGGSFSGEHGDGQSRAEFLPKMFGDELIHAFGEFKSLWDPDWKMNPGKVVDPFRMDQNLRLGPGYNPPQVETYFRFPEDRYSFADATLRCVGIGDCRRLDIGTMCPSFMVTREEMHSTRGRARLLFEMLQGDPLRNGWKDEHVKESLDLCLACKGCKGDCPVNTDMATYKAEFMAHYYAGRIRPLHAYAFGLIFRWARLAELMPGMANFVTHAPVLRSVFKGILGVPAQREIPPFAPETFKHWFRKRSVRNGGRPKVILWPDTFNNHFFPETAKAAVDVLEAADFQVIVPQEALCCGRPLYDFGLLDQAMKQLRQVLDVLHPYIEDGTPVVGLEPSCIAVLRDEMLGLFPEDEDAKRLASKSYMLSEFLQKHAKGFKLPEMKRKAVVHGHCHHKSFIKFNDEEAVLHRLGLDYDILDSGCCGMAGAFGFDKDKYDVSISAGERVLLPAVRQADDGTIIITDGFSCREQISQTTDRHALHLAEVIQMAMEGGPESVGRYPESKIVEERKTGLDRLARRTYTALGIGALAAAGGLLAWSLKRRSSR